MNTDLAVGAVAIDHDAVLKYLGLNPRDAATQALLLTCQRYGLDPVMRHMVLISGRPYVTRDGLLHVAHRSRQLDGIEVLDQGETPTHFVAKVAVYRKDMGRPFAYVGRYPKNGHQKQYGPEMAVKCAEVMSLRRAFDVALCAREELWDQEADTDEAERVIETRALPAAPPPWQPVGDVGLPALDWKSYAEFELKTRAVNWGMECRAAGVDEAPPLSTIHRLTNAVATAAVADERCDEGGEVVTEGRLAGSTGKRDRSKAWAFVCDLYASDPEWVERTVELYLAEKLADARAWLAEKTAAAPEEAMAN